ncbi:MAG TPA: bifunctional transaldolase/phosoglucose isomerase [Terriglobales bacterium]|nr:bifunctional transaldolase/phosoglucose isomerase [Terriglobales bacterium]
MNPNPLVQLGALGQSVWMDQIRRALLTSGELKKMIREDDLRGLTSNPTIFEKAISGSNDYADSLRALARKGASVTEIYDALVTEDIAGAADSFRGVYDRHKGNDGYVSLEVSPLLAHDTARTIKEAKALFTQLNRPNVMIKVPGTAEGLPAIEELIASGLNINVTLIFSVEVYEQVTEAYIKGLERRVAAAQPINNIASVASFFVSRIDTAVDKELDKRLAQTTDQALKNRISALHGQAAIANAKLAYDSFKRIFNSSRFATLKARGARVQRPLWASTSTKNPKYSDVMYVETLIGPDTVDTMPPQTIDAYRDHGKPTLTLEKGLDEAHKVFAELKALGIDFKAVTDKLTVDGVRLFAESYEQLLEVIRDRRDEVVSAILERHTAALGKYQSTVDEALKGLEKQDYVARAWKKDSTVWKSEPEHQKTISNALGWLTVPQLVTEDLPDLAAFDEEVRGAGFEDAVVLGMGGSSLCPEVLSLTFGRRNGSPRLHVLDSTVPAAILHLEQQINLQKTLFIVSSKSGTTTEPQMFYRYFFDRVKQIRGKKAGENFVAITDPGTQLQQEAERNGFRRVFLNPADIGGRYSALSYFGMVPLAVMGGPFSALLGHAVEAMHACSAAVPANENPGLRLGAAIGALANAGRNKVTFITPPPIDSLALWIEQLIAESTGKEGKGIVPVAGEPLGPPEIYGDDRVFVYIRTKSVTSPDIERKLEALQAAGHPVLRHILLDSQDLGQEFFLWEFATPVAGKLLGIDPFDQPNVQESKDNTRRLLAEYSKNGKLAQQELIVTEGSIHVLSDSENRSALANGSSSLSDAIQAHLARVRPGDYVAITQYIDELPQYDDLLQQMRVLIRNQTHAATTTGYGPRFLHSTSQLHQGGLDSGVFIQITSEDVEDVKIPGEVFSFGILKQAQALGDFESLSRRHRRAIRIDLGRNVEVGLKQLLAVVQGTVSPALETGVRR